MWEMKSSCSDPQLHKCKRSAQAASWGQPSACTPGCPGGHATIEPYLGILLFLLSVPNVDTQGEDWPDLVVNERNSSEHPEQVRFFAADIKAHGDFVSAPGCSGTEVSLPTYALTSSGYSFRAQSLPA